MAAQGKTHPNKPESKQDAKLRVVDTFLRAMEKLTHLAPEVQALEEEVAGREAVVLDKIMTLMGPIFDRIAKPIILREPWADPQKSTGQKALREPGIILVEDFQHSRESDGSHLHTSTRTLLVARRRLVEVVEVARWKDENEGSRVWKVETAEVGVTPDFARVNLRTILTAILDALRDALAHDIRDKRELKERLNRLEEAERALG
jgi:hypothetical protein